MSKDKTLFGFIGNVCKQIADGQKSDDGSPIATEADVRAIVQEMVTANFINGAIANENATTPTAETVVGEYFIFGNGTPLTIKERTDGVEGCIVAWDGGEFLVDTSIVTTVFGGRHDDETPTNSSITIEGGTVNHVIGGGLHKAYTVNSKIVMNGGTVRSIRAGACDQWIGDCSCDNVKYGGPIEESWCRVDNGELILNAGHVTYTVFGGNNGFARIKNTSITVGEGMVIDEYLYAGGANGSIENAKLVINGGQMKTVAGCCRGIMDTIDITVNGGTIESLFAGEVFLLLDLLEILQVATVMVNLINQPLLLMVVRSVLSLQVEMITLYLKMTLSVLTLLTIAKNNEEDGNSILFIFILLYYLHYMNL